MAPAAVLASLAAASPAAAITIEVTITGDVVANDGECSLREAVTAASDNAGNTTDCLDGESPGLDTIRLGAGLHQIGGAAGDDANLSGDLDLDLNGGPVVLDGAGQSSTTIDANDTDRVLHAGSPANVPLTISDLTITDGALGSGGFGAGINVASTGAAATVTIVDAAITDNTITGTSGTGAGVHISLAPANLTRVTISGNRMVLSDDAVSVVSMGGGIRIAGGAVATTITDTTISGNGLTSADPNDSIAGAGLGMGNPGANLTISRSTFTGNFISGGGNSRGAGLDINNVVGADQPVRITNTTFSANTISGAGLSAQGGGIHAEGGLVSIAHTTFADNAAANGRAIHLGLDAGSTFAVRASILAEGGSSECSGGTISSGGNNIAEGSSCAFAAAGDQQGVDPALLPLADNGGPTRTHALPASSPAVDKVASADCDDAAGNPLAVDQRGEARPFPAGGACDSGTFELQQSCLDREATIVGTAGANALTGTVGSDVVLAGGGNDTITPGGGDDRICGGAGIDTASFAGGARVSVDLGAGTASGQGSDRLSEIENARGSSFADTLLGNGLANLLKGAGGKDILKGKGGPDSLLGGGGADRLLGGGGRDRLSGGAGKRDLCNGGAGQDRRRAPGCERKRKIP